MHHSSTYLPDTSALQIASHNASSTPTQPFPQSAEDILNNDGVFFHPHTHLEHRRIP
ncbi:hypothetical protein L6R29_04945 [Myxococcota bacterium]|nr:hypothetical protein [Myxococcota bacterium]